MSEIDLNFLKKQIRIFMNAIDSREIPSFSEKVCFSDWDLSIEKKLDVNVYTWLHSMLRENLDFFEKECFFYKEVYPKAYFRVMDKIEQKKVYLSRDEKIKLFMKYINNKEVALPHARCEVRFCDINNTTKNTTNVGSWLEKHLQKRANKFLTECFVYHEQYPIAYEKILYRIQKRDKIKLDDHRLQLWLKILEENLEKEIFRFCEFDESSLDSILIESWLSYKIQGDLDLFLQECLIYKEKFPRGVSRATFWILTLKKNRAKVSLSEEERFSFLIKYLNREGTELNQHLCFCDLFESVMDTSNINSWLCGYFLEKMDVFLEIIFSYQSKYPIAYSKLLKRKDEYLVNCIKKENLLSYEEKMQVFLSFLNENKVEKIDYSVRFCDISVNTNDDCNVESWFRSSISKDVRRFYLVLISYKDVYPIGYDKVVKILNDSKERLQKSRILFIQSLNEIKENVLFRDRVLSKKLAKK